MFLFLERLNKKNQNKFHHHNYIVTFYRLDRTNGFLLHYCDFTHLVNLKFLLKTILFYVFIYVIIS